MGLLSLIPPERYHEDYTCDLPVYGKSEFRDIVRSVSEMMENGLNTESDKDTIKENVGEVLYAIECLEKDDVQYLFAQSQEVRITKLIYQEMELLCSDYCRFNPLLTEGAVVLQGLMSGRVSRVCETIELIETVQDTNKRGWAARAMMQEIAEMMDTCKQLIARYDHVSETTLYVMSTGPWRQIRRIIGELESELNNALELATLRHGE